MEHYQPSIFAWPAEASGPCLVGAVPSGVVGAGESLGNSLSSVSLRVVGVRASRGCGLAVGFPGVSLTRLQQRVPSWNLAFTGMVVVGFSVLIWFFPVVMDPYGDAPYLVPTFPWIHPEVEAKHVDKVLNMDLLDPKIGTSTVVGLVYILSAAFEVSIQVVWRLLDLAAGALFAGVWLSMVHRARLPRSTACVMGVTGLTAPWLLVFSDISRSTRLSTFSSWFSGTLSGVSKPKRTGVRVGWLLLVFVLNLKVHVTGVVAPSCGDWFPPTGSLDVC